MSQAEIVRHQPTTAAQVPSSTMSPGQMMAAEWDMMRQQAEIMARTEVVPKQFRGKPDDIIAAALYGRELGFGLATSLVLIDVIEGNPELNAEGKLSLIRSRGHSVQGYVNEEEARLVGTRIDNGDTLEVVFTYAEAEKVQIASWTGDRNNRRKTMTPLVAKDNWQNFRQDMLWARAVSRLGRRLFGDVLQGFSYDRDEIEAHIMGDDESQAAVAVAKPIPMVRRRPDLADNDMPPPPAPAPAASEDDASDVLERGEVIDAVTVEDQQAAPQTEDVKMASSAQHKFIEKLLGAEGIEADDREARHAKVSEIVGRQVTSLNELTSRDASKVIDTLNK